MHHINLITRRGFMERNLKLGLGIALSTLVDIPLVVKRALAANRRERFPQRHHPRRRRRHV
ncbi:MAG: hypothetical protein NTZ16_06065 [Verrucomicrobia bacterium]|nr:hypothetical protein [Verrucomicrobiota bacterium]